MKHQWLPQPFPLCASTPRILQCSHGDTPTQKFRAVC